MNKEQIDKAIEEIREHCLNNACNHCEAQTIRGCVFMSSYPMAWFTTEEADKIENEE